MNTFILDVRKKEKKTLQISNPYDPYGPYGFLSETSHFFWQSLKKKPIPTATNTKNQLHKTIQSCNNIIIARNHWTLQQKQLESGKRNKKKNWRIEQEEHHLPQRRLPNKREEELKNWRRLRTNNHQQQQPLAQRKMKDERKRNKLPRRFDNGE